MTPDTGLREALRATASFMAASAGIPVERRDEWCDKAERLFFAELRVSRSASEPNTGLDAAWLARALHSPDRIETELCRSLHVSEARHIATRYAAIAAAMALEEER